MLVTNRHVVANMTEADLVMSGGDKEGNPIAGSLVNLPIRGLQSNVIYHPDPSVDLAAIAMGGFTSQLAAAGQYVSFVCLSAGNIPQANEVFTDVEDVMMIGYPIGLYDTVNNRPVIRRGITATSLGFDYEGKAQFLIDAPSLGGSSGSPVVIANEGSWSVPGGIVMGTRFRLVGILYAQMQYQATGKIVAVPVPTATTNVAVTDLPMNLGLCIKAHKIHDLVAAVQAAVREAVRNRQTVAAPLGSVPSPPSLFPRNGALFT